MSAADMEAITGLGYLADLEASLLARIDEASDHLRRAEGFDEEQRAEMQAILDALRHETHFHTETIRLLDEEHGHA